MDTKVTRQRIDTHLEYDWYKYILILIAAIAVWIFGFQMLNNNREHEVINIFVTTNEMPTANVRQRVANGLAGQGIRAVNISTVTPRDTVNFFNLLSTHGMISGDILIMPSDLMPGYGGSFMRFDDSEGNLRQDLMEILELDEADTEFFEHVTAGEHPTRSIRGIRIDNLARSNEIFDFTTEWIETEEKQQYYLVINLGSANIGIFGNASTRHPERTQTFDAARILLDMMRNG